MKLTAFVSSKQHLQTVALSALACLLFGTMAVQGAPLSIIGVGYRTTSGLAGEMYRFSESGMMLQKSDIVDSRHAISIATFGMNLYVAGFRQAINRYDLHGQFLGQFADVRALAGATVNSPILETDTKGSVYVAYGGQSSEPRTSFRLNRDGNVTASYSHASLVFPHGIDATASGDAYILNSAGVGIRDRLFKFDSNGGYLADFAIPETDRLSDIAINETSNELYIADEVGSAIHVYDISSGAPIFRDTLSIAERPVDVFVEPISGRIFGTAFEIASDEVGLFRKYTGFEISRGGQLINLYAEDAIPREQSVNGIVAVVPEPASALLFLLAVAGGNRQCRARRRTEHD